MRFPQFTGNYLSNRFGVLVNLRTEKYDPLKSKNHFPCIELENIEQESCILNSLFDSIEQKSIKTKFKKGDILFGKLRPYLKKYVQVDFDGVCSTEIWAMNTNSLLNRYVFYYIQTTRFLVIANTSSGTKMPRAEWSLVSASIIKYPNSIEEMQAVSKFLSLIDRRIETQSKIIEKIKLFKNIISDHLLYSNQLSEFINLSYYATLKNGYTFKSSEYDSNGIYNVITIANVTGERYIDIVGCNKINAIPQDIQEHQQLKNNNILISLTGNVGRVSLCNKNNCLLNQRVGVLEIKNDNYNEFIFQCLSNKHFEKTMILKGQGVAQLNICKKDVENFKIPKISLDKLNQICNILNFLDKKIAIEKEIFNDYHQMKKYLLLNMFI